MINKANLMTVLESMRQSAITNTEHAVMNIVENQTSTRGDIFQPNAVVRMGDITRYYSLYNGEPNTNHPAYDNIPVDGGDDIFVRYFDVIKDKVVYVSTWIPIDIPPDRHISDDHRFTITDHDGDSIDITDIEWTSDIPAINLSEVQANENTKPNPPERNQTPATAGGFRIWFCMLETGREGESTGKGDRVDHRVCIVTSPKIFPTKPFIDALSAIPHVNSIDHYKSARASYVTADVTGVDARVILFENSAEPIVYDSEDIIDVTNDLRDKYKMPVVTTKSIIQVITKVVENAMPTPEPVVDNPAQQTEIPASKPKTKTRVNTTAKKTNSTPKQKG